MTNKPIAIIGAGNGGQTTAAWLSNQGYQTRIFDVMEDTVAKLNELGGVNIYGNTDYPGFGKIQFATTDIAKAIDGCEVIFIILPEIYHVSIAQKLAPHLLTARLSSSTRSPVWASLRLRRRWLRPAARRTFLSPRPARCCLLRAFRPPATSSSPARRRS